MDLEKFRSLQWRLAKSVMLAGRRPLRRMKLLRNQACLVAIAFLGVLGGQGSPAVFASGRPFLKQLQLSATPLANREGLVHVPFPMGLALLQVTDSGLREDRKLLARTYALASRAAQGTLSPNERAVLDAEYQYRILRIDQIAVSLSFQGILLLDGSQDVCLEGRPPVGVRIFYDLPDATVRGLGIADTNVISVGNALASLERLERAIDTVAGFHNQLKRIRRRITG